MFSVNNTEEAERLLILACPTNVQGEYVAPELAEEQTLDRLYAFGDRLAELYEEHIQKRKSEVIAEIGEVEQ